ncbi:MAG: hypothetical protein NTW86_19140 [Candidatus Sumerlaeota bacterium]|nr:hypothetical protein [Candidatus Sumerlaeota bacterium]
MQSLGRWMMALGALAAAGLCAMAADAPADPQRAKELYKKVQRGETLTSEEQAEYQKAVEARKAAGKGSGKAPETSSKARPLSGELAGKGVASGETVAVAKPLIDMTAEDRYKGEDGGLYGGGRNTPPEAHLQAALAEAAKIQPLDADGQPSPQGKIVLMSMGMSNTTLESQAFVTIAMADGERSKNVVALDGSRSGETAADWAIPREKDRKGDGAWATVMQRLTAASLSAKQVQAVWAKMAEKDPATLGEFPEHARRLQQDTKEALALLKQYCPNVRIAYVSSRTYGGYANVPLNPEPYAYESAFAMRWLIQDQLKGEPSMSYEAGQFPLLLWGPYLWANGAAPRADGFAWAREDYKEGGTHVTDSGAQKVAEQLLHFFKTDPTAKTWFVEH